jgi:hypothetical protein
VLDGIAYARGWTAAEVEEQLAIRKHLLELMARKGVTRSAEVSGVFNLMMKTGQGDDREIPAGGADAGT